VYKRQDLFDDCGLGGHDWVVWDVVCKFAAADNDMAQTYAIAAQEKQAIEQRMISSMATVQKTGPAHRIDIAGQNSRLGRYERWNR